jgi:hypothetical protein
MKLLVVRRFEIAGQSPSSRHRAADVHTRIQQFEFLSVLVNYKLRVVK